MELTNDNLKKAIASFLKKEESDIKVTSPVKDLVRDSFLLVELVMTLQEDFSVRIVQDDLKSVETVQDLIEAFLSKK